jgi:DUF4097 and DUF4098 domain-containing protein YvlB
MTPIIKTFPLSGPINLSVRLGHGSLAVTAADDLQEAVVRLTPRGASDAVMQRITVEMQGPTLSVSMPRQGGIFDMLGGWRRERDGLDVQVTIPSGTALKIVTFTADVSVRGRCGGADIASGSADIALEHVDGDLLLRYGAATSTVSRVDGSVTMRSGSGNASFGEVAGSLQSGCGSGRLDARAVHGTVRTRIGSGAAHRGAVYGDVDLASGSGGLSIGLPAGMSARVDVTTGSGRVESELPIEDNRTSKGPSITVRARTGSGNVRVFRAA